MILSELFPAEPSHRHTHTYTLTDKTTVGLCLNPGTVLLKYFTPRGTEKGVDSIECHF